jgi:NDP-sugar pyrophosphorylase family protein
MMAVVLAGGLGMRLRPYTMNIPKPLLPLGDQATMEIVLQQLAGQGFERVVITLGHMPQLVEALLGDGRRFGLHIEYIVESEPLGTAGSLNLVEDLDETFLVMNGDLLTTIDYGKVLASQEASDHSATVVLARREVPIDYGVVYVDEQGNLARYEEKPVLHHYVSTGIYALDRFTVSRVPKGRFDMPDLITDLVAAHERVRCHITDEYWQDIGRFDDFQRASADFVQDPERFLPLWSTKESS